MNFEYEYLSLEYEYLSLESRLRYRIKAKQSTLSIEVKTYILSKFNFILTK